MKNLRFVCAQPCKEYYLWQVEVMIHNFIQIGINPNNIDIVCSTQNGIIPVGWSKLARHYNYVRFFFYNDTRKTKHYISSIRPNILKQHWIAHPELENDAIFYHDNDIVFTKPIDWSKFLDDDKWYGSDTRWYISHDYILSKGEDILNKMCDIVGIDRQIVKDNELNCIGAQYLMKNLTHDFWETIELQSEELFNIISEMNINKVTVNSNYHPVQIWCADMWTLLWNAWKMEKTTVCHPDFEFSWGTSVGDDWNRFNIFHNAGVVNDKEGLFYKANYIHKLPYGETLNLNENSCSFKYWKMIQDVGKISVLCG